MVRACHYCGENKDLRPYGPKGEWVCFECAFATPERRKQTEMAFEGQLNSAGPLPTIGLDVGPVPLETVVSLFERGHNDGQA